MKRKLIRRNKARMSVRLNQAADKRLLRHFDISEVTFESISQSKKFGQRCHKTRLSRQQKTNPRQLKKLRKRQQRLGLVGSKYGGICETSLRPARANFKNLANHMLSEVDIIQKLGEFRELPTEAIVYLPDLMSEIHSTTKRNPKLIDSCLMDNTIEVCFPTEKDAVIALAICHFSLNTMLAFFNK